MNAPSVVPKHGLVPIIFTRDFKPFDVKEGDVRYVSPRAAESLKKKWQIVRDFTPPPEPKPEPALLTVRVARSLVSTLGSGWYPNSEHVASRDMIKKYLDDGSVVPAGNAVDEDGQEIISEPAQEYHGPDFQWYASHPTWQGQSVTWAVNCVTLAYQCGEEKSHEILIAWIKKGYISNKNGKIFWN